MERKALRLPALVVFGIYAIYSCALVPLYEFFSDDIILRNMIAWDIIEFFLFLFEVLGISASFGFLIHGIYLHGAKKCRPLYILLGGALLFKYAASIVAVSIVGGSLDLTADFTSYLVPILIEIAELLLVILLSHRWITALQNENKRLNAAATTLGQDFTPRGEFFPLRKLFCRNNPLQRTAFWGMVAVTALRLISYVIGEITFSLVGYGFSAKDIPIIALYALLLVFIPGFLGYLLSLGCMRLAERHKNKEKAPEA